MADSENLRPSQVKVFVTGKSGFIGSLLPWDGIDLKTGTDIRESFELPECDVVVHLAALKSVDESVEKPLEYWETNLVGTLRLLQAMKGRCNKLVFASSAAVYGVNPYGESKLACEWLISSCRWVKSVCFRIHNIIECGVHEYLKDGFVIYGKDYPTRDGTAERDYMPVDDVVIAIERAVGYLASGGESVVCDLGTGVGRTVLELVKEKGLPVIYGPQRTGDLPFSVACIDKAKELGFV